MTRFNQFHGKRLFPWGVPLALMLALATGACDTQVAEEAGEVPEPEATTEVEAQPEVEGNGEANIQLAPTGVNIVDLQTGEVTTIAFATSAETAQSQLESVLGTDVQTASNSECGAGPMDFISWENGLTLNAQNGNIVGWYIGSSGGSTELKTAEGIGLGSDRTELEAAYPGVEVTETSLGTEFISQSGASTPDNLNYLGGILTSAQPSANIGALYAGINCFFR